MTVFDQVATEQRHNAEVQKYKFNYTYTVSANVAPNTTTPFVLAIETDADFMFEKFTGSAYGPCTTAGIPTTGSTDFPMPGIGAAAGFAGRGLTVEVKDVGSGRDLTRGAIPVELLLTPGYGINFHLPYPVKYFASRNSKIQFTFANRDTQADANHQVDIAINGYKFQMPIPESDLRPTLQIQNSNNVAGYVSRNGRRTRH